jgi:hypothetical protein
VAGITNTPFSSFPISAITLGAQERNDIFEQTTLNGALDDLRFYTRSLSDAELQQLFQYEAPPTLVLLKAVKPFFFGLRQGTNYQLQLSGDLANWTNQGSPFTATNSSMVYPQYWDVDNWGQLFFRLQMAR